MEYALRLCNRDDLKYVTPGSRNSDLHVREPEGKTTNFRDRRIQFLHPTPALRAVSHQIPPNFIQILYTQDWNAVDSVPQVRKYCISM
jgi:hypothetical protein